MAKFFLPLPCVDARNARPFRFALRMAEFFFSARSVVMPASGGFGCAFDFGPVGFGEVEVGGFHVFFEVLYGRSARDGQDDGRVMEEPGE
jgi:hypothetical protein